MRGQDLPAPLQVSVTFVIVLGGWAIFRAESMDQLVRIWSGMVGMFGIGGMPEAGFRTLAAYSAGAAGLLIVFAFPRSDQLVARFHPVWMTLSFAVFLVAGGAMLVGDFSPFL